MNQPRGRPVLEVRVRQWWKEEDTLAKLPYLDGPDPSPSGSVVVGSRQYEVWVTRDNAPDQKVLADQKVLVIELRAEEGPCGADRRCVADVAILVDDRGTQRRIKWWETAGLAKSNELVRISPSFWFLRELEFPTSGSALASWIKKHWASVAAGVNPEGFGQGKPRFLRNSEIRDILAQATRPEGRLRLGSLLTSIAREAGGLSATEAEQFDQLRDRSPAEPIRFE